jgi:RND family efflux transporter MFP subunit
MNLTWQAAFGVRSKLLLVFCLALAGCSRGGTQASDPAPIAVSVVYPIEREITDYADLVGRTAAVESVEVRARVWGHLDKVNFKEGALVKKGEVLYEIDPRPYRAALANAEGNLSAGQAKLKRLDEDLARALELIRNRAISRADYDQQVGDRNEADAQLDALRAAVDQAKLDLNFTKIIAPINGRISRTLITEGNLITAGQTGGTLLTNIVSVDPMYAYFDADERSVQQVRKLIREGKARSARDAKIPVWLGLITDQGHPHEGTVDFVDNQVNAKTGTLRLRGVFPNPGEPLSPGYFVRIRLPIGFPHKVLLISDRAIDTDQGQKIVYVIGSDNTVATRPVRLGAKHDGLRVIESGLEPGERIVVTGLQQIRAGAVVQPSVVEMPSNGSQASKH